MILSFLGPGLIAANAGNDAGAVATWSSIGARYGYALLWALVVVTIALAVVQEMCARMGAATGEGLSDLIRERFGVRGAAFAMTTLFVANALVTISEFAGMAAAGELIGISKYITVPLAAAGIWFVITRGSYERVEKVFLLMALAFFTYPIAAILAHPNWGDVLYHSVVPTVQLNSTYFLLLVGAIGTTITPYMQLYIQSSVAEKGVTMEDYAPERTETYGGSIFAGIVVGSIVIATGATVFAASGGKGVAIESATQAAQALRPVPRSCGTDSLRDWAAWRLVAGGGGCAARDGLLGLRVIWLRARRQPFLQRGADLPWPLHRHDHAGGAGRTDPWIATDRAHHRRADHQWRCCCQSCCSSSCVWSTTGASWANTSMAAYKI